MSGLADHTASPASDEEAISPASGHDVGSSPTDASPPSSPGDANAERPRTDDVTRREPPSLRERARIRRRARFLRQLRELQLRDIGGFLVEQLRLERENPAVVRAKVEEAAGTDSELRALERALTRGDGLRELREAGIGGACAECGTVHGSSDRYCSWCGRKL